MCYDMKFLLLLSWLGDASKQFLFWGAWLGKCPQPTVSEFLGGVCVI